RMDFSIPAGLRVLDSDRDGFANRLYVGDMGAQVWRIDFINGNGRASLAEGGVIASLGAADDGAPTRADARRFYNTPDAVDLVLDAKILTAINIGSGYRAHPLDATTDEEFYSIRDFRTQDVIPTADYGTPAAPILTRANLIDVTDNVAPTLLATDPGWRLRLDSPGEKILGSSLTISNVLFFNSFTPAAVQNSCLPGGGQNRLYRVNVFGASPLTNLDFSADPDNLTPEDRYVDVGRQQDVPLVVMPGPDGPCSGVDCFDGENELTDGDDADGDGEPDLLGSESGPQGTYWFPVTRP
ncbi:MAG: hypothetical protein HKN81_02220, partial [Gammaproteobacteria bacterium]|nr:hypothetical protein [Gammaproteobacteria bacterium]